MPTPTTGNNAAEPHQTSADHRLVADQIHRLAEVADSIPGGIHVQAFGTPESLLDVVLEIPGASYSESTDSATIRVGNKLEITYFGNPKRLSTRTERLEAENADLRRSLTEVTARWEQALARVVGMVS